MEDFNYDLLKETLQKIQELKDEISNKEQHHLKQLEDLKQIRSSLSSSLGGKLNMPVPDRDSGSDPPPVVQQSAIADSPASLSDCQRQSAEPIRQRQSEEQAKIKLENPEIDLPRSQLTEVTDYIEKKLYENSWVKSEYLAKKTSLPETTVDKILKHYSGDKWDYDSTNNSWYMDKLKKTCYQSNLAEKPKTQADFDIEQLKSNNNVEGASTDIIENIDWGSLVTKDLLLDPQRRREFLLLALVYVYPKSLNIQGFLDLMFPDRSYLSWSRRDWIKIKDRMAGTLNREVAKPDTLIIRSSLGYYQATSDFSQKLKSAE